MIKITGCEIPCKQYQYSTEIFNDLHRNYIYDGSDQIPLKFNDTESPMLMIKHMKRPKIKIKKEIIAYKYYNFISDSGGMFGILLGTSFWSVYKTIKEIGCVMLKRFLRAI